MRTLFVRDMFVLSRQVSLMATITFFVLFQVSVFDLWAEEKDGANFSLNETIELALNINSQRGSVANFLPPEKVIFQVKKYFYQLQTQHEQLDSAEEVRGHFQKAVDKSEEIMEEGEGDISQSDITKLKLGLSGTLNNIISLKHGMQIARLHLGQLIGRELGPDSHIAETDIIPVAFSFNSFDDYLKAQKPSSSSKNLAGKVRVASSKTSISVPVKLSEKDRLEVHKAFIGVKEAAAKVQLGKKNRKITRALLVAEVANYDFGIGDSQELFEALIIYTRVLSGYLDSIYTLNVAVAELGKLSTVFYQ